MKNLIIIAVLAALAWFGYSRFWAGQPPMESAQAAVARPGAPLASDAGGSDQTFKCDGRTMCSQMTSCAEATYFIQHCPNTKMDGNNDGEPCERQWCN